MLLANAFDEGRDFGEPAVVGFVGVIVDRVDVAVQIGRAEDRYLYPLRHKAVRNKNDDEKKDEDCQRLNERREFSVLHLLNG